MVDEKPPCSQWGETENLRNMAALCCNASTLLRAALSLLLFIISRSKTPALHCLWGKKKVHVCVCVLCVCSCTHMCCVCVYVYACVRLHSIHIKQFWRWLCFPGCHEYKRKHPSSWNTISQVVTVKLTLPSDCRHTEEETQGGEGRRETQTDTAASLPLLFRTLLDSPDASHIKLIGSYVLHG